MKKVSAISFFVEGSNITQGSFNNYGVGKLVPVNAKELNAWRKKVAKAFQENGVKDLMNCNLFSIKCVFFFEAPKAREKKASEWMRTEIDGVPLLPRNVGKDVDKMLRSICDSFSMSTSPDMKAKNGINDSKIYKMVAEKYEFPSGSSSEGVLIELEGFII